MKKRIKLYVGKVNLVSHCGICYYKQNIKELEYGIMEKILVYLWETVFVLMLLAGAGSVTVLASQMENQPGQEEVQKDTKKKKDRTIAVTISAAGDCTLGVDSRYHNNFNSYYSREGAGYFLKKVRKIFGKDDITLVNFEGTLTNSAQRANKTFTFKGPAAYTKILKKGSVEVVNLANNHSMDFGASAFKDKKRALRKDGIGYCHYGTIAYKKVKGVKAAILGFNQLSGVSHRQIRNTIQAAQKKKAKIIIVSFHWGIERDYYPDGIQKSLGKYAIDQGADLVIGHHPHVLQGIEKYKGRYIVYSLGNFCFGGNVNPSDKDTMIFQQTFYIKKGKLLKKKEARIIPCSLSSVSYTNNYQPVPLSGREKNRLIKKMNRLSKGMHVTIKSSGRVN